MGCSQARCEKSRPYGRMVIIRDSLIEHQHMQDGPNLPGIGAAEAMTGWVGSRRPLAGVLPVYVREICCHTRDRPAVVMGGHSQAKLRTGRVGTFRAARFRLLNRVHTENLGPIEGCRGAQTMQAVTWDSHCATNPARSVVSSWSQGYLQVECGERVIEQDGSRATEKPRRAERDRPSYICTAATSDRQGPR